MGSIEFGGFAQLACDSVSVANGGWAFVCVSVRGFDMPESLRVY